MIRPCYRRAKPTILFTLSFCPVPSYPALLNTSQPPGTHIGVPA